MFPNLGPMEMMLIMGLGVLLFGKRLPEVGRSLGRGIVEFKKGLNGVGDDFDVAPSSRSSSSYGSSRLLRRSAGRHGESAYTETSVPKFELPGTASARPRRPPSRPRCRRWNIRRRRRRIEPPCRPSALRLQGLGPAGQADGLPGTGLLGARRSASVSISSGGTGRGRRTFSSSATYRP